jgi:hypothetical protein
MRKVYFACCLLLLAGIYSCKKNDLKGLNGIFNKNKCDYIQASAPGIIPETTGPIALFTKTYDASSRLQSIYTRFRNVATGIRESFNLTVSYLPGKMIFLRDNGDTSAVLNFSPSGRLTTATAATPFYLDWSYRRDYNFIYSGNALREIQITGEVHSVDAGQWIPFIQLAYDNNGYKNITRLTAGGIYRSSDKSWIDYRYDRTKRAKAQVYPDDMFGDYHMFYFFLKYLNVIPGLQPENLLASSSFGGEGTSFYPASFERQYSNHQLDADGKLVSYTQHSSYPSNQEKTENWQIDWTCFK